MIRRPSGRRFYLPKQNPGAGRDQAVNAAFPLTRPPPAPAFQPTPSITPTVSSAAPDTLLQGTGYLIEAATKDLKTQDQSVKIHKTFLNAYDGAYRFYDKSVDHMFNDDLSNTDRIRQTGDAGFPLFLVSGKGTMGTEEVYIGGANGILPPRTHEIGFRLDGFGANPSDIELTNVELGLRYAVDDANAYNVIPTAGTGGSVSPNMPQSVNPEETINFTVTGNEGYTASSTVGGTCPQGSWLGDAWSTGTINDNCTVSFIFDLLDADAVPAASDNYVAVANTNQRDTDGDGYDNLCDGGLNNSGGVVNFVDLSTFKRLFGKPVGPSGMVPPQ